MPLPRRRKLHHHRLRPLVQIVSAVSAALLILFAILSFLSPSPDESEHFNLRHHHTSVNAVVQDPVTNGGYVFSIPSDGGKLDREIWSSRNAKFFYGCSNASAKFAKAEAVTHPTRYLAIAASGGLNQQRTGITDAVVAARILNATLVVPILDQKSFWKDASNFTDIFDVDWFISFLSKDVKIIKKLPKRGGKTWTPYTMRVPRKCSERCYVNRVLPVLLKKALNQCIVLSKQWLFHSIIKDRFESIDATKQICDRFEPDMLAFSGCDYGGGEKERNELGAIQKRWKTLHKNNPDKERRQGRCPLTPEEVGLMLRALGYGSDVHIYVASGEVYGGEETLRPLKALFPNFYSKDTIATKEELGPFSSFSSRMAALDFIVCDESDVFVTNNNGNMARILAGRRKYFGHKPTIRPNAKKLYRVFLGRNNMTWEEFASRICTLQRGFMGEPKEVRPGRGEFHENPSTCICEDSEAREREREKADSKHKKHRKLDDSSRKDVVAIDDQNGYEENDVPEWPDLEDEEEDQSGPQEKLLYNATGSDYDAFSSDEPELEVMLSDE
ncbi:hypothetical protein V6N12_005821 [Hibiscus sabdariffa]|uniref:O-fucosyltransferase family protein n=1 Tax=Hibiscus sabdariffa TaxID=183260 RepID=A0ABR1ZFJ5_9ROSI